MHNKILLLLTALYAVEYLIIILMIGKKRDPLTPAGAAFVGCWSGFWLYVIWWLAGGLH